ncbi:hypothetical protein ACI65C_012841 [Semiaphis heraclei]
MPQSSTLPFKDKDKINNPKLNTIKTNNGDPNQRTIQLNKNKSTATKTIHVSDVMDTSNNDNSSSGEWISSTSNKNKTKRIHSNSSDSSSPRSPANKNKKLFFSTNRYEVLSHDNPPSASPSNDNNSVPIQNPTDSINLPVLTTETEYRTVLLVNDNFRSNVYRLCAWVLAVASLLYSMANMFYVLIDTTT